MLERPEALRLIDAAFPNQPLVLTLGGTIREMLAVVGQKPNHLYCLDAMGQPLAIGLGLSLGVAQRVVVVEGDGSVLMGFSALTTVGHLKPRNLVLLVLDNSVYLATGGQPTAARDIDLVGAARACGWAGSRDVDSSSDGLRQALEWAAATDGPLLIRVPVSTVQPKTDFFLEDPVVLGRAFTDWLAQARRSAPVPTP
ncbi:MAG TPA: thiamine pyrophosphate-dependent enzyme [Chloroflexota bacterium]|jgi:thiamine pyrophosphate-dependent acetolactate synthase large subunit-like protein